MVVLANSAGDSSIWCMSVSVPSWMAAVRLPVSIGDPTLFILLRPVAEYRIGVGVDGGSEGCAVSVDEGFGSELGEAHETLTCAQVCHSRSGAAVDLARSPCEGLSLHSARKSLGFAAVEERLPLLPWGSFSFDLVLTGDGGPRLLAAVGGLKGAVSLWRRSWSKS